MNGYSYVLTSNPELLHQLNLKAGTSILP